MAGLTLTKANYYQAIEQLEQRFGCKQLNINKHMDVLLRIDSVTTSQSVRDLNKLFDDISCHVHSLSSLGVESGTYGGLLCSVLMSKIPQDLQFIISRKVSKSDWNVDTIMKLTGEELIAWERFGGRQCKDDSIEYKTR